MTKNVGSIDAGIRAVIAGTLILLAAIYNSRPLPAIAVAVLAVALLTTAVSRYCPSTRCSARTAPPEGHDAHRIVSAARRSLARSANVGRTRRHGVRSWNKGGEGYKKIASSDTAFFEALGRFYGRPERFGPL